MERDRQTHTIETRSGHWANALLVAFLLWTGFSMFAGDRHFASIVRLLPAAFWHAVHVTGSKRQLFTWHTYAGAFFALNGVAYVASLIVSGAWKRIVPKGRRWLHDAARPLDYSIPQRIAYSGVMIGAILMVLTGVALWFKHQIPWLLSALGGERLALPAHAILASALLAFIAIHVSQVLLAGATTFRSMTVGQASADGSCDSRMRHRPQYR